MKIALIFLRQDKDLMDLQSLGLSQQCKLAKQTGNAVQNMLCLYVLDTQQPNLDLTSLHIHVFCIFCKQYQFEEIPGIFTYQIIQLNTSVNQVNTRYGFVYLQYYYLLLHVCMHCICPEIYIFLSHLQRISLILFLVCAKIFGIISNPVHFNPI